MAKVRTKIPIPPSQWVKDRQNSIPLGKTSISVIIVAPVVVNPDTVSKNASTKEGILPENTKGKEPKKDTKTHPNVTIVSASLARILSDF